ncbi:MAG: hypothetical protein HWE13_04985 [Gammaproteobacteria bacterium]|nr:hypothetical protein [Gammaproteobacteria bacterium]NVK87455.1 hypothetical protein [Gammaproteobacteria bacterium]
MKAFDVVILTDDRYVELTERSWYCLQVMLEDELLVDALTQAGLKVCVKSWSDPEFDWSQTRSVLFSSTWDYFDHYAKFSQWFDATTKVTQMINPAATITWNMDKHYLLDLQQRGINTVETHIIKRGSETPLSQWFEQLGYGEAIVKPTISGAARHTYRVNAGNVQELEPQLQSLIMNEDFMIQPFQNNIIKHGELSLMVMGGTFTHAVKKVAAAGDFRVQDDHGGQVFPYIPSAEEIEFAQQAVAACEPAPLYARVDMIRDNQDQLAIMELELIEPELFFRYCRPATQQLAKAVVAWLNHE